MCVCVSHARVQLYNATGYSSCPAEPRVINIERERERDSVDNIYIYQPLKLLSTCDGRCECVGRGRVWVRGGAGVLESLENEDQPALSAARIPSAGAL